MFLWGVKVLELESYPDHNKGPDPRTLYKFLYRSEPHYIADNQDPLMWNVIAPILAMVFPVIHLHSIEHFTFPKPSGCAICYATDAGY